MLDKMTSLELCLLLLVIGLNIDTAAQSMISGSGKMNSYIKFSCHGIFPTSAELTISLQADK